MTEREELMTLVEAQIRSSDTITTIRTDDQITEMAEEFVDGLLSDDPDDLPNDNSFHRYLNWRLGKNDEDA